jgi:hypothetical protein
MWYDITITDNKGYTKIVSIQAENRLEAGILAEKIYDNWRENSEKSGQAEKGEKTQKGGK